MKPITALMICLMVSTIGYSQSSPTPRKGNFSETMTAVLKDFTFNYKNISGDLVLSQGEIDNYASNIELEGSESCMITRYHSALDTTASWQAIMGHYDEYDKAAKAYSTFYRNLNNVRIKLIDGSILFLKGNYESPKEELQFVTSALHLQTGDDRYKNLKVELELLYEMNGWVININVVSKEDDSKMRPDWMGKND
jgi:hypothetical protein